MFDQFVIRGTRYSQELTQLACPNSENTLRIEFTKHYYLLEIIVICDDVNIGRLGKLLHNNYGISFLLRGKKLSLIKRKRPDACERQAFQYFYCAFILAKQSVLHWHSVANSCK